MNGLDLILWAIRALSFFNTIAFVWLGLAVLLNAERRVAGTLITGGGLAVAGLFFAFHSTLVGRDVGTIQSWIPLLWRYHWLLFISPPYLWYLVISWYSGALHKGPNRAALFIAGAFGAIGMALVAAAGALPTYGEVVGTIPMPLLAVGQVPVISLAYPAYGAVCYLLTVAILRRPGSSTRLMGEVGRLRARPWLVAASLLLLGVSISVGAVLAWHLDAIRSGRLDLFSPETTTMLLGADLGISALLAIVVTLLGRAIVSYEIFTGKVLPRRGLRRHWLNSLVLAAGYGVLVGGNLTLPIHPIYPLTLATLVIAVFYGLLSWRSFAGRERHIRRLRPFVGSQRLYEQILTASNPLDVEVGVPFRALCEDVLDAQLAYLVPLGSMAPLVGKVLSYPPDAAQPIVDLGKLAEQFPSPDGLIVTLDPCSFGDAMWAVPLWSERGLIGALLLGQKHDGGLYVQEEIEIAQAAGERLTDIQASAEVSRRLMAVQRQRLAESQLLDHRVRRVLHDDVLPRLHAALLGLSSPAADDRTIPEVTGSLASIHRQIANLLREVPAATLPEVARLGLVGALKRLVDGELRGAFDGVEWKIDPHAENSAETLSPLVAEVVFSAAREAMRNAAHHGRGEDVARHLHLVVSMVSRNGLCIGIEDDGVGMRAGVTKGTGSGQGLALHSTMMAVIGGTLEVETSPGAYTRVSLILPREAFPQGEGL